ncbi:MAG: FGGY family carbohydrate kinase, partial [Candidatus Poribacteria bacterium]
FNTGSAVQWLRDGLKIIKNASETEDLANSVPDTGGVYLVPAFTGLGAPYWDAEARGIIVGITRGTIREHIVRATLESIAYQTYDVLKAMQKDYGKEIKKLRVDGGAVGNNFLMQFQSDVLNIEVDRSEVNDVTALGAAFLAGLSIGFWSSKNEVEECRITNRIFRPNITPQQRDKLLNGWYDAIGKARYKQS